MRRAVLALCFLWLGTEASAQQFDTDQDGLPDQAELQIYHTNPLDPDTDDDGLEDGEEVLLFQTDPLAYDTDNDEIGDGDEFVDGTNPLVADYVNFPGLRELALFTPFPFIPFDSPRRIDNRYINPEIRHLPRQFKDIKVRIKDLQKKIKELIDEIEKGKKPDRRTINENDLDNLKELKELYEELIELLEEVDADPELIDFLRRLVRAGCDLIDELENGDLIEISWEWDEDNERWCTDVDVDEGSTVTITVIEELGLLDLDIECDVRIYVKEVDGKTEVTVVPENPGDKCVLINAGIRIPDLYVRSAVWCPEEKKLTIEGWNQDKGNKGWKICMDFDSPRVAVEEFEEQDDGSFKSVKKYKLLPSLDD